MKYVCSLLLCSQVDLIFEFNIPDHDSNNSSNTINFAHNQLHVPVKCMKKGMLDWRSVMMVMLNTSISICSWHGLLDWNVNYLLRIEQNYRAFHSAVLV